MIRNTLLSILLLLASTSLCAQSEVTQPVPTQTPPPPTPPTTPTPPPPTTTTTTTTTTTPPTTPCPISDTPYITDTAPLDSLHLPSLSTYGQPMPVMRPLHWGSYLASWDTWSLHTGLNMSLGASVFTSFGKNAPSGVGFTQSLAAMYAVPVTGKLSMAVGGYFNNINWGRFSTRTAGMSALIGYQFDMHWEGYLYAQKQILTNMPRMPYPMIDCAELGDRIGAAIKYNFSPSFSVQLSVERNSY